MVYGHLHIPRVTWYDGVGSRRCRSATRGSGSAAPTPPRLPRQILPVPGRPRAGGPVIEQILPLAGGGGRGVRRTCPASRCFPPRKRSSPRPSDKRRQEFTTARACARRRWPGSACRRCRSCPAPRGAPQWPTAWWAASRTAPGTGRRAVARADGDRHDRPRRRTARQAAGRRARGGRLAGRARTAARADRGAAGVCWDRLLFSAKESVYKAWFPLTAAGLASRRPASTFDAANGSFTARLLVPARW